MDSILGTIKTMLGDDISDTAYDTDLVVLINSAFMELNQIGVGPDECFRIEDDGEEWDEFLEDDTDYEAVKEYIYLKVKTIFDPPQTSFAIDAMNKTLERIEWRLNFQAEVKRNATQNG